MPSTAARVRITTSLALQLSTAVLQDSCIFCMSLSSKGNGEVVRTTISETFESLILELFFSVFLEYNIGFDPLFTQAEASLAISITLFNHDITHFTSNVGFLPISKYICPKFAL